jgi:hypothetical protein
MNKTPIKPGKGKQASNIKAKAAQSDKPALSSFEIVLGKFNENDWLFFIKISFNLKFKLKKKHVHHCLI